MDAKLLEELGLTAGEIKVYLALLELGPTSAGKVIEKSGLQNSVVHFCLNSLKKKGLVSYVKKGRIRIYNAADPENFLSILEDRKKAFKALLPELKLKQKLVKEKPVVEFFEGIKGLINMFNQFIADGKRGDEFLFFTTDVEEKNIEIQKFYRQYDVKRKAKGLIVKGLAPTRFKPLFKDRPIPKVRYIDFPIPANIAMFKDKMVLVSWEEVPTGVLLKSEQIVDKLKSFFNSIWNSA